MVSLALLVDDRGLPIYSRIYPGNQPEPETLADVLVSISDHLEQGLFTSNLPTVVMDRGIATRDNIELIESFGLSDLVITRSNVARHYLTELRDVVVDHPNQAWATDITYIPYAKVPMYLMVNIDWHSKKVLSWRLSNTMGADFCVAALAGALAEVFSEHLRLLQQPGVATTG